eukprot:Nk52_evm2s398 gene=Nk52_evmTU2s398
MSGQSSHFYSQAGVPPSSSCLELHFDLYRLAEKTLASFLHSLDALIEKNSTDSSTTCCPHPRGSLAYYRYHVALLRVVKGSRSRGGGGGGRGEVSFGGRERETLVEAIRYRSGVLHVYAVVRKGVVRGGVNEEYEKEEREGGGKRKQRKDKEGGGGGGYWFEELDEEEQSRAMQEEVYIALNGDRLGSGDDTLKRRERAMRMGEALMRAREGGGRGGNKKDSKKERKRNKSHKRRGRDYYPFEDDEDEGDGAGLDMEGGNPFGLPNLETTPEDMSPHGHVRVCLLRFLRAGYDRGHLAVLAFLRWCLCVLDEGYGEEDDIRVMGGGSNYGEEGEQAAEEGGDRGTRVLKVKGKSAVEVSVEGAFDVRRYNNKKKGEMGEEARKRRMKREEGYAVGPLWSEDEESEDDGEYESSSTPRGARRRSSKGPGKGKKEQQSQDGQKKNRRSVVDEENYVVDLLRNKWRDKSASSPAAPHAVDHTLMEQCLCLVKGTIEPALLYVQRLWSRYKLGADDEFSGSRDLHQCTVLTMFVCRLVHNEVDGFLRRNGCMSYASPGVDGKSKLGGIGLASCGAYSESGGDTTKSSSVPSSVPGLGRNRSQAGPGASSASPFASSASARKAKQKRARGGGGGGGNVDDEEEASVPDTVSPEGGYSGIGGGGMDLGLDEGLHPVELLLMRVLHILGSPLPERVWFRFRSRCDLRRDESFVFRGSRDYEEEFSHRAKECAEEIGKQQVSTDLGDMLRVMFKNRFTKYIDGEYHYRYLDSRDHSKVTYQEMSPLGLMTVVRGALNRPPRGLLGAAGSGKKNQPSTLVDDEDEDAAQGGSSRMGTPSYGDFNEDDENVMFFNSDVLCDVLKDLRQWVKLRKNMKGGNSETESKAATYILGGSSGKCYGKRNTGDGDRFNGQSGSGIGAGDVDDDNEDELFPFSEEVIDFVAWYNFLLNRGGNISPDMLAMLQQKRQEEQLSQLNVGTDVSLGATGSLYRPLSVSTLFAISCAFMSHVHVRGGAHHGLASTRAQVRDTLGRMKDQLDVVLGLDSVPARGSNGATSSSGKKTGRGTGSDRGKRSKSLFEGTQEDMEANRTNFVVGVPMKKISDIGMQQMWSKVNDPVTERKNQSNTGNRKKSKMKKGRPKNAKKIEEFEVVVEESALTVWSNHCAKLYSLRMALETVLHSEDIDQCYRNFPLLGGSIVVSVRLRLDRIYRDMMSATVEFDSDKGEESTVGDVLPEVVRVYQLLLQLHQGDPNLHDMEAKSRSTSKEAKADRQATKMYGNAEYERQYGSDLEYVWSNGVYPLDGLEVDDELISSRIKLPPLFRLSLFSPSTWVGGQPLASVGIEEILSDARLCGLLQVPVPPMPRARCDRRQDFNLPDRRSDAARRVDPSFDSWAESENDIRPGYYTELDRVSGMDSVTSVCIDKVIDLLGMPLPPMLLTQMFLPKEGRDDVIQKLMEDPVLFMRNSSAGGGSNIASRGRVLDGRACSLLMRDAGEFSEGGVRGAKGGSGVDDRVFSVARLLLCPRLLDNQVRCRLLKEEQTVCDTSNKDKPEFIPVNDLFGEMSMSKYKSAGAWLAEFGSLVEDDSRRRVWGINPIGFMCMILSIHQALTDSVKYEGTSVKDFYTYIRECLTARVTNPLLAHHHFDDSGPNSDDILDRVTTICKAFEVGLERFSINAIFATDAPVPSAGTFAANDHPLCRRWMGPPSVDPYGRRVCWSMYFRNMMLDAVEARDSVARNVLRESPDVTDYLKQRFGPESSRYEIGMDDGELLEEKIRFAGAVGIPLGDSILHRFRTTPVLRADRDEQPTAFIRASLGTGNTCLDGSARNQMERIFTHTPVQPSRHGRVFGYLPLALRRTVWFQSYFSLICVAMILLRFELLSNPYPVVTTPDGNQVNDGGDRTDEEGYYMSLRCYFGDNTGLILFCILLYYSRLLKIGTWYNYRLTEKIAWILLVLWLYDYPIPFFTGTPWVGLLGIILLYLHGFGAFGEPHTLLLVVLIGLVGWFVLTMLWSFVVWMWGPSGVYMEYPPPSYDSNGSRVIDDSTFALDGDEQTSNQVFVAMDDMDWKWVEEMNDAAGKIMEGIKSLTSNSEEDQ